MKELGALPETIPLFYGVCFMLGTALFFEIINRFTINRFHDSAKSTSEEFWKWKNIFVSWIHSMIITVGVIICLYAYGQEMWQDLIDFYNLPIYGLVAFTTGYFIYDFTDVWRYDSTQYGVLMHHVCVFGNFFYNVLVCRCLPIAIIALTVEINTLFLHSRKLLQIQKMNFNHWFYRTVCWTNLISFFIIRFGALSVIGYGFYHEGHRLSFYYMAWLWPSWVTMNGISIILFWRLIKSDVIKYYSNKKKVHAEESNNNTVEDTYLQINDQLDIKNGHLPSKKE